MMLPYILWGTLKSHHHFAKVGEIWNRPWQPSQPHPVKWQLVRADTHKKRKPWIWILWLYPDDGSAIYIEFGFGRRATKAIL